MLNKHIAQVLAALAATRNMSAKPVILLGFTPKYPMQHGGGVRKHRKK